MGLKHIWHFMLFFITLLLYACISIPQLPVKGNKFDKRDEGVEGKVVLYIYRNSDTLAMAEVTQVYINGNEASRLPDMGYSKILLEPGCYNLSQSWPEYLQNVIEAKGEKLCFKAGQVYYLKIDPVVIGWSSFRFGSVIYYASAFKIVEKARAIPEILQCYSYDLKKLRSRFE